jgi:hypothetical protein
LLRRASSDLANLLASINGGVAIIPAATVSAKVRYRYIARSTTQTVYVTVKDAAGKPLQGVRVDIAFPKPAGGTTLIRRYTTVDGKVTAWGRVGTTPYGKKRDVKVTVQTGAVTMTLTPWFMATAGSRQAGPGSRRGSATGRSIRARSFGSPHWRATPAAAVLSTSR